MLSEFALIDRYFKRPVRHSVLGVGDDAAIVRPSPGCELLVSTDMLAAGTHFLPDTDPEDLGWKALAVNVSDMAAMGANPRWALLACALPAATEPWISRFATGFFACADAFGIDVIGGDTTKGSMNFCVTIFGEVPQGAALLRSGAKPGDEVWVSGQPGRAALGLAHLQGRAALAEPRLSECLAALHRPQPRVALGLALRGLATAAIDVSDGLLADLGHILEASGVAASLRFAVPPALTIERDCMLSGGDDYELVFTAPAGRNTDIGVLAGALGLALTCIGSVAIGAPGTIDLSDAEGRPVAVESRGYDHFITPSPQSPP
ncbi:MAG: thiamine-phosphate kinase [Candidatus Nitricoxidivorans perseverans]|uniref:Thiamine-monophosphate kinase n=1 Tax=Candidatus Nitricoxidivorans perseverans TaxID=2975601 RepID=A0AA49FK35_9PROT|nr:MAG: thiamine-phosphate kinase [Candidatus Nitricoxidivorans perseverans]